MNKSDFNNELKFILLRSIFLDCAAYLISVFFIGFTVRMAVGLLLGTFGMTVNLYLLYRSVARIVNSGGSKAQSFMMKSYLFRLFVTGVIIVISMKLCFINTVGTVLPYFYPKLVYTGSTLFRKGGKSDESV